MSRNGARWLIWKLVRARRAWGAWIEGTAGVVEQYVDVVGVLADPLGEPADVVEFRIVRGESHRTGVGGDGVEFVGGASDEDQVDLGCREGSGGDRPDAVTGTGDHDGCARTHGGAITFGDEDAGYGRRSARSVACRCGRILEQGLAQGDQVEHVEHHRFGTEVSTDVSIHLSCSSLMMSPVW